MTIALKDHATISIDNDMTFEHLSGAGGATRGTGVIISSLSYHPRNFGYNLEFLSNNVQLQIGLSEIST